jgi:hypothetical protein
MFIFVNRVCREPFFLDSDCKQHGDMSGSMRLPGTALLYIYIKSCTSRQFVIDYSIKPSIDN